MRDIGPVLIQGLLFLVKQDAIEEIQVIRHLLFGQRFVETIERIGRGRHQDDFFRWHIRRDKLPDRMTDVAISLFHVLPDKIPGGVLGCMRLIDQAGHNLDMRSVDDFSTGISLFDIRNEA